MYELCNQAILKKRFSVGDSISVSKAGEMEAETLSGLSEATQQESVRAGSRAQPWLLPLCSDNCTTPYWFQINLLFSSYAEVMSSGDTEGEFNLFCCFLQKQPWPSTAVEENLKRSNKVIPGDREPSRLFGAELLSGWMSFLLLVVYFHMGVLWLCSALSHKPEVSVSNHT